MFEFDPTAFSHAHILFVFQIEDYSFIVVEIVGDGKTESQNISLFSQRYWLLVRVCLFVLRLGV
jgi:hypothetical protein